MDRQHDFGKKQRFKDKFCEDCEHKADCKQECQVFLKHFDENYADHYD